MKRLILAILVVLSLQQSAAAADRIRIGYSSISGAYTPIWVAHDAGYFAKEGLADDIILIPSGTQLAQVTVAGEIDIGSLNGSSAIAAALSGADLKIIGNSGNKMVFSLYVRPEIKTIEAMKGKKIGITRYGSAPDLSVRYALRKLNINPELFITGLFWKCNEKRSKRIFKPINYNTFRIPAMRTSLSIAIIYDKKSCLCWQHVGRVIPKR